MGLFMAPFVLVVLAVQHLDPGASPDAEALAVIVAGYLGAQALWQRSAWLPRTLATLLLVGAALLASNVLGLSQAWPG